MTAAPRLRFDRAFWNLHARSWDDDLGRDERRDRVGRLAAWAPPAARVVDLGCGTGSYVRDLAEWALDVTGVDFAPAMLERARAQAPTAQFVEADLDEPLPFADAEFDAAACVYAFQCVREPARFLEEVRRVLRPGGAFLAVVVGRASRPARPRDRRPLAQAFWLAKLLVTPPAALLGRVRRYSAGEAARLLTDAGFEVLEQRAAGNATELLARRNP